MKAPAFYDYLICSPACESTTSIEGTKNWHCSIILDDLCVHITKALLEEVPVVLPLSWTPPFDLLECWRFIKGRVKLEAVGFPFPIPFRMKGAGKCVADDIICR